MNVKSQSGEINVTMTPDQQCAETGLSEYVENAIEDSF